jgi:hypothetical protein
MIALLRSISRRDKSPIAMDPGGFPGSSPRPNSRLARMRSWREYAASGPRLPAMSGPGEDHLCGSAQARAGRRGVRRRRGARTRSCGRTRTAGNSTCRPSGNSRYREICPARPSMTYLVPSGNSLGRRLIWPIISSPLKGTAAENSGRRRRFQGRTPPSADSCELLWMAFPSTSTRGVEPPRTAR